MSSILTPTGKRKNHKKGIAAAHLARKREEALERQALYNKKTAEGILASLNAGNYQATRQRQKLAKRISAEKEVPKVQKKETKSVHQQKRRD